VTKRRSALTLAMFVFSLMTVARPAEAQMWDWLQEWSGPGPFTGYPVVMASVCNSDYVTTAASRTAPSCPFFDYRDLEAEENDNFPIRVRVRFWDVGMKRKLAAWKLQQSVEGGVAVGLMHASGDKDAGGKSAVRFTVTAPRLVVMPVLLAAELFGRGDVSPRVYQNSWLRVLKLYASGTVIVGPLDAEALGVDRTLSDYSRNSEYVLSRGFVLDFGELIPELIRLIR
jgi:hypothetical protein